MYFFFFYSELKSSEVQVARSNFLANKKSKQKSMSVDGTRDEQGKIFLFLLIPL
jgi:hypothetical protein